jgi:hypothetical protein
MQVYTLEAGAQMLAVQVEMTTRIVTALKGARARAKTHNQKSHAVLPCMYETAYFTKPG